MDKPSKIEEIDGDNPIQIISDLETLARLHAEQSKDAVSPEISQPLPREPEKTDEKPLPAPREVEIILPAQKLEVDNSPEPEIVEPATEEISPLGLEIVETAETSQLLELPVAELPAAEQPLYFEPYVLEAEGTDMAAIESPEDDYYEQEFGMEPRIITEDTEDGAPMVEATPEVLERPTLPDSAALEIFEEIEARISNLEPEKLELTNEILGKIIEVTSQIHSREIPLQDFEEAEAALIELCGELFDSLGLDYSEEETRQAVKMWIIYSHLKFLPEENTDSGFKHLFDDMGTHEGLRQFMISLSRIKRIAEVIYSALGKFALSVLQIREHDKQLVIRPIA